MEQEKVKSTNNSDKLDHLILSSLSLKILGGKNHLYMEIQYKRIHAKKYESYVTASCEIN